MKRAIFLLFFVALSAYPQSSQTSTVILYRRGGAWSRALDFPVSLDGRVLGSLHNGLYIRVSASPGRHIIVAGGSFLTQGDIASLKTAAGKTYYVRIDNIKALHEHVEIRLVDPRDGARQLSGLKELVPRPLN